MENIVNFNGINCCKKPTIISERRVGMLTKSQLSACKDAEFSACSKNDLTDIADFKVDKNDSVYSRMSKYFEFVKNPYMFRVGDIGVKINCLGTNNFSDSIMNIATNLN